MRRPKGIALALLAAVAFAEPFVPLAHAEVGAALVSLGLLFWWYHLDKAEHGYRAGPLMNGAMLLVAAIALPVYFLRSRGWKRGLLASLAAAAVLGLLLALGEAGELVRTRL